MNACLQRKLKMCGIRTGFSREGKMGIWSKKRREKHKGVIIRSNEYGENGDIGHVE